MTITWQETKAHKHVLIVHDEEGTEVYKSGPTRSRYEALKKFKKWTRSIKNKEQ